VISVRLNNSALQHKFLRNTKTSLSKELILGSTHSILCPYNVTWIRRIVSSIAVQAQPLRVTTVNYSRRQLKLPLHVLSASRSNDSQEPLVLSHSRCEVFEKLCWWKCQVAMGTSSPGQELVSLSSGLLYVSMNCGASQEYKAFFNVALKTWPTADFQVHRPNNAMEQWVYVKYHLLCGFHCCHWPLTEMRLSSYALDCGRRGNCLLTRLQSVFFLDYCHTMVRFSQRKQREITSCLGLLAFDSLISAVGSGVVPNVAY